jgi:hypothetical protein
MALTAFTAKKYLCLPVGLQQWLLCSRWHLCLYFQPVNYLICMCTSTEQWMSFWLVRSWLISTRLYETLSQSATAPLPHVLFAAGNRSECTVKWLVLRGVEPSIITPPVSLVIFVTLKYSLTSEDMQRRVSCSDARKPSSLCTWYEVSPCICCTVKLAAKFVLSVILMVHGDTPVCCCLCLLVILFSLILLWKPILSVFCYTYFAIYFPFVV